MAVYSKTGETTFTEWLVYGDSTSLASSVAHSAVMVLTGVLVSPYAKKAFKAIVQPDQKRRISSGSGTSGSTRLIA